MIFAGFDLIDAYENRFIKISVEKDKVFHKNQPDTLEIDVVSGNRDDIKAEIAIDLPRFWKTDINSSGYLIGKKK